eukprot:g3210.t1
MEKRGDLGDRDHAGAKYDGSGEKVRSPDHHGGPSDEYREGGRVGPKRHDAAMSTFRRVFLNNDCSLRSHHLARAAGRIGGDFTYSGPSAFLRGDVLVPHGERGTQRGEFGHVSYVGAWEMGRRHGKGCSYRANGSVEFDGDWFQDGFSEGQYYLPNGRLEYEGAFDHSNNLPHGAGTFFFADDSRYEGNFLHGHFHGQGVVYSMGDELIVQGRYEMGRLVEGRTDPSLEFFTSSTSARSTSSTESTPSMQTLRSASASSLSPTASSEGSAAFANSSSEGSAAFANSSSEGSAAFANSSSEGSAAFANSSSEGSAAFANSSNEEQARSSESIHSTSASDHSSAFVDESGDDTIPNSPIPEGVEIPKLNLDRKDSQTATSLLLEAGGILAGTTSSSRNATNLLGAGTEGNEVTADSQIATGRLLGAAGTQSNAIGEDEGTPSSFGNTSDSENEGTEEEVDRDHGTTTISHNATSALLSSQKADRGESAGTDESIVEDILRAIVEQVSRQSNAMETAPQLLVARDVVREAVDKAIASVSPSSKGLRKRDKIGDVDSRRRLLSEMSSEAHENDEGAEENFSGGSSGDSEPSDSLDELSSNPSDSDVQRDGNSDGRNDEYDSGEETSRVDIRMDQLVDWTVIAYAGKYNIQSGEPEATADTDEQEVVNRVDISGLWEDAEPTAGFTHACYGTMRVNLRRGIQGIFYGCVLDGQPCGNGIVEVTERILKTSSKSKFKKQNTVRKVARFWFGRSSSCMFDHDQLGVPTATEHYQSRWRRRYRSMDSKDMNGKYTLEATQRVWTNERGDGNNSDVIGFSGTISDSGDSFIPLTNVATEAGSTFYMGKTFNNTTPCGLGKMVCKRGARPMNPLAHTFEGFWDDGRQRHGTTRWENGDIFVGEHDEHGRPHGSGRMEFGGCMNAGSQVCSRFCTGPRSYTGEWSKGKLHGVGELKFLDGRVYRGGLRLNTLNGPGTMQYPDGRVLSGTWLGAWPLHPATHIVVNATLRDKNSTTKVSRAVHGYAHGNGVRVWHKVTSIRNDGRKVQARPEVTQDGTFHWGIFIKPTKIWVTELVLDIIMDDVFEEVSFRAANESSSVGESEESGANTSSGDSDKEGDAGSALLTFAQGQLSSRATDALLAVAHELDGEAADGAMVPAVATGSEGEAPSHAESSQEATRGLLSAAHAISDEVVEATSKLLVAASSIDDESSQ